MMAAMISSIMFSDPESTANKDLFDSRRQAHRAIIMIRNNWLVFIDSLLTRGDNMVTKDEAFGCKLGFPITSKKL